MNFYYYREIASRGYPHSIFWLSDTFGILLQVDNDFVFEQSYSYRNF